MVHSVRKGAIGIDPSFTNTAVVLLTEDLKAESIVFHSHTDKDWYVQYKNIRGLMLSLCNTLAEYTTRYQCVAIVLEGYSYGSHYQGHNLGELGHAYRTVLSTYAPITRVIPPRTIKKAVAGSGRADKLRVAAALDEMGLSFKSTDESDACAAAYCGLVIGGIIKESGVLDGFRL